MFAEVPPGRQNEGVSKSEADEDTRTTEIDKQTESRKSTENTTSNVNDLSGANPVEIDAPDRIYSVKFFAGGKYIVTVGMEGKIRRWRVEDGKEVGKPMDAGCRVYDVAVSQDGEWIVNGTENGQVTVWDGTSHKKVTEFKAHKYCVRAVDLSPGGKRIATGSSDMMLSVWSLSTSQRLLGPLQHYDDVVAVKFPPDGQLIATATRDNKSVRVYDSSDGRLLVDFPVQVKSSLNQCLAWTSDNQRLFALSRCGDIHCLDIFTKKTLSHWPVHSDNDPRCIALAGNDTFIVASADSSTSLWNTTTHRQIGAVIDHSYHIWSMAISEKYDIAVAGDGKIIIRQLCDTLASPYHNDMLWEEAFFPLQDDQGAISHGLRHQLAASNEEEKSLQETIPSRRTGKKSSNASSPASLPSTWLTVARQRADYNSQQSSSADIEQIVEDLGDKLSVGQYAVRVEEKRRQCEAMYADGRINDAVQHLLESIDTTSEEITHNELIMDWLSEFTDRCISRLRTIGDEASRAEKHDDVLLAYSTILSLVPSPPEAVLMGWARMALICSPANAALAATTKFKIPRFHVYRVICDTLYSNDRVTEAIECLRGMQDGLSEETSVPDQQAQWELEFRRRCVLKLQNEGDTAMNSGDHDEAIGHYSSALLFDPENINDVIVKCCEARVGWLKDELTNASTAIDHDPSSCEAFKRKHAVLHSMGRYSEAFDAFEAMLSRMEKSPDPEIRKSRDRYLDTTPLIQNVVEQTIRNIPRALIDTTTGFLHDKTQQAMAFEESPIYNELRSSMITRDRLDCARIEREVKKFFAYVMFSHRWQPSEPTFQDVEKISIYGLPESPTHNKLIKFCKLVRSRRFRWAWSDTCCVNQADRGIQQESVVAMFRWYRRAALTIVHLLGVFSASQRKGSLWKSIWNTRGWTYQEYVASRVIQFYTEDWKPYLGLDMYNHKESPIILSEMEQATKFTTDKLATLQPGFDRVREKLFLASNRQTTREEDIAYSLFGIFNIAIPVIYGEGNQAVGRLLEHILPRSNDVTLLSWTGVPGSHHSYLPSDLTVYDRVLPPHAPQSIEAAELNRIVVEMRSTFPDPSLLAEFYQRLHDLPSLSLDSSRLKLPALVFPLAYITLLLEPFSDSRFPIYRATSPILGDVRIETSDDLSGMKRLILLHPWINPLLDEDFSSDDLPVSDLPTRALRLLVRLRQPFGGLLLASHGRVQYKRVATDSFIKVQIREETPLKELMDSIRTVDVQ